MAFALVVASVVLSPGRDGDRRANTIIHLNELRREALI